MAEVRGDLHVLRTGHAARRMNQGLVEETEITAQYDLDKHSHWWHTLKTDDNGEQDVVLPDATGLIDDFSNDLAWQVVVHNVGTVDSINVKTYSPSTPVLRKAVAPGRAYAFTLYKNDSQAGLWHVNYLEESDGIVTARYVQAYNATTNWGSPSGGYYTITVLGTTHARGSDPVVQLWRLQGSDYIKVILDRVLVDSNDDCSFRVPQLPDLRYAGKIVMI